MKLIIAAVTFTMEWFAGAVDVSPGADLPVGPVGSWK